MRFVITAYCFVIGLIVIALVHVATNPPTQSSFIPEGYYDLSVLPDELQAKFADPEYLQRLIIEEEMKAKLIAAKEAEIAERTLKTLPDGLTELPVDLTLYEPDESFNWPSFEDLNLHQAFESVKSDWVIVNYWASWCAPCIAELPDLDLAAPRFSEMGLHLLPLNTDPQGKDNHSTVQSIYKNRDVHNLPQLIATDQDITTALDAAGMARTGVSLPFNLIYAPGGEPYAYFTGLPMIPGRDHIWSSDEMVSFLDSLISGTEAAGYSR